MKKEEITPEYIVEQSKILSDDELWQLIEDYGTQEYNRGVDNYAGGQY